MTLPAPTYDLVLLLDPQADDATREQLIASTRTSIEAQGELLRHDDWGERALTYPIDRKPNAQYHLMQFHAGNVELLSGLDRTLRLADEVLRFRIIKLAPGVASPPDMAGAPAAPQSVEGEATPQAEAAPAPAPAAADEPKPAAQDTAEPAQPAEPELAVGDAS